MSSMTIRPVALVFAALLILLPITFFSCGAVAANANAASKGVHEVLLEGRHTVYWEPQGTASKMPLIIFSHAFHGCNTQSSFLMEALAASGYWVFAPNHDDAVCSHHKNETLTPPVIAFDKPESWDDTTYTDRADDLRDVLDALQHSPQFKDRIDFAHIGLVGHSLGGYAVLGLAGAWPSWKMPGVKAVLGLSPYSEPFNVKRSESAIKVPVMLQGGTRDIVMTPDLVKSGGTYEQLTVSKFFIEFDRAPHSAWTDSVKQYRASIDAYALAFFDHYVKGLPATPALTAMRSDVADFRYNADIGKSE